MVTVTAWQAGKTDYHDKQLEHGYVQSLKGTY